MLIIGLFYKAFPHLTTPNAMAILERPPGVAARGKQPDTVARVLYKLTEGIAL